jgi:hypothetical protein
MGSALRDTSFGGEYTQGSIPQRSVENDGQEYGLKCVKLWRASELKNGKFDCAPGRQRGHFHKSFLNRHLWQMNCFKEAEIPALSGAFPIRRQLEVSAVWAQERSTSATLQA